MHRFEFTTFRLKNILIANDEDAIDPEFKPIYKTDADICKFGNLILKRGEKLKNHPYRSYDGTHNIASCEYILPPFVTCSRADL